MMDSTLFRMSRSSGRPGWKDSFWLCLGLGLLLPGGPPGLSAHDLVASLAARGSRTYGRLGVGDDRGLTGEEQGAKEKKLRTEILAEFRDKMIQTFKQFHQEEDAQNRREVIMSFQRSLNESLAKALPKKDPLSRQFEDLMGSIEETCRVFRVYKQRYEDACSYERQWVNEALRIFQADIKDASDFAAEESAGVLFRQHMEMIQRAKKSELSLGVPMVRQVYSSLSQIFASRIRQVKFPPDSNPSQDLKANTDLIRRTFPVTSPELKERNREVVENLENSSKELFRAQNAKKG